MEQVAPIIGFSHDPVSPCNDWYEFYEWRASRNAWVVAYDKPPAAAACLSTSQHIMGKFPSQRHWETIIQPQGIWWAGAWELTQAGDVLLIDTVQF